MPVRLFSYMAGFMRRAILVVLHAFGVVFGHLLCVFRCRRQYTFSRINIELCREGLNAEQSCDCLIAKSLREFGKLLFETTFMWACPWLFKDRSIRNIYGEESLRKSLLHGKSVVLVCPHLGNWEVFNLYLGKFKAISTYKPLKTKLLDAWIKWARESNGSTLVPINQTGIKLVCSQLRKGGVVMILADQVPERSSGRAKVPFFGVMAWTGTMVSRLAQQSNVEVMFGFARRLPKAKGFDIHLLPAPDGVYSSDLEESAASLNTGVENCIRISPEQYLWQYKRFKGGIHPELYYKQRTHST